MAASIPFELVENLDGFLPQRHPSQTIPPELQIQIAFWSFPENEEDIRLYSCLANGSDVEFQKGDNLLKMKAVKNPLQIGFHLMSTVTPGGGKPSQSTSVTFDRKKITKCSCSCNPQAEWCAHVVALCLHRIHQVCMSKNQLHEIFSQSFVVVNFQDLFTTYFFYLSFFTAKFCRKKSSNE